MKISTLKNVQSILRWIGRCTLINKVSVLVTGLMILALSSWGQGAQNVTISDPAPGFEIDGDLRAGTTVGWGDWFKQLSGTSPGYIFGDDGTRMYNDHLLLIDDNPGGVDKVFTSADFTANPNTWTWQTAAANPGKSDITNAMFYLGTQKGTGGNPSTQWLFVGATRAASNGTSYLQMEFLQNALVTNGNGTSGGFTSSGPNNGRTKNDMMLEIEFPQGGNTAAVSFFLWTETSPGVWAYTSPLAALPSNVYWSAPNTGTILNVPSILHAQGNSYADHQFVEAAINLTKLFAYFDPCLWIKVQTLMIMTKSTKTSNNPVDFVQPVIQTDIDLGTAFGYKTPLCTDGGVVSANLVGATATGTFNSTPTMLPFLGQPGDDNYGDLNLSACTPGDYVVTYKFNLCGVEHEISHTVKIEAPPTVSSPGSICVNGIDVLSPTTGGTWTSTNPSVATVSNAGVITGISQGTVKFIFSSTYGCSATTASVTVYPSQSAPVVGLISQPRCYSETGSIVLNGLPSALGVWKLTQYPGGSTMTGTGVSTTVSGLTSGTYSFTVTNANGCTSTPTGNVSITVPPLLVATISSQTNVSCNGGSNGSATVSASGGTPAYTYLWSPSGGSLATASGLAAGVYTVTVTDANSCTKQASVTITQPAILLAGSIGSSQSICYNTTPNSLTETTPATGGPGSYTYQWQRSSDNSSWTNISGATSSTYAPGTLTTTTYYRRNVTSGSCGTVSSSPVQITVYPLPLVNALSNVIYCNGASGAFIIFNGPVSGTNYSWASTADVGFGLGGSGTITTFTALNAGTTPVVATITVIPSANGCIGTSSTFTVTVNPTAQVNDPADQVVCNGTGTTAVNFGTVNTGGTTTYSWTNNTTSIGLAASGNGNIASFTAVNTGATPVVATITVTPHFANGSVTCDGPVQTFTITVNPTAQVNDPADQIVCNGSGTTAVNFGTVNTGGTTTYSWTNNTIGIGLAASGNGNISSFTAVNTGTAPIVATITVTPHFTNGSVTCDGPAQSFTITINPSAQVNDPADQVVCNGSGTTAVNFGTTNTGGTTTYSWTNNTTSIGLGASGNGNISSFTAVNTGTTPVVATITVTPHFTNGSVTCDGPVQTFTITVNPTAQVNDPADQVLCNGSGTTAVNFGTVNTGGTTTYSWTNNTTSIGLAASGTGNINSFAAVNTGITPVVATITVTPHFTNASVTCDGPTQTFTITVNPAAQVNDPADQVVCNGSATTAINFGTTNTGGTTTYSWTNNTTSIGLGASGSGNIASFTAVNTGTAPVVATITVTPHFNNGSVNCDGLSQAFTITVNPTAQVNDPADQVVCNGTGTTAVNFGTVNTGGTTTYSWTNNTTSIGLAASGNGNIASFTAVNTGTTPVVATITVTPHFANGSVTCDGPVQTFTITVNPTPSFTSCPSNIVQGTDLGNCTAVVNYTATAVGTPVPAITYSFTGATVASGTGTGSGSTFNKGVTTVVITASNICANVTCSFTVTVNDDQKPVLARCAATLNIEGCSTSVITSPAYSAVSATSTEAEFENATNNGAVSDNCGITSVSYIDVASGTCPIVVTRSWLITDAAGNSVTCTQTINVKDTTAPTWTTAASNLNRTLSCEDSAGLTNAQSLVPVANDACDASLTPVKTSGVFVPAGCGNAGIYTNTFKVTDDCGNTSGTFTQVITITDTKTPTWTTTANALDRTLSCEDLSGLSTAQALVPVATDNCDITLTPVKTSGAFVPSGCGNAGIYTNTFKVTDDCGNESSIFTQVITITDTKAPTWTSAADALNVTLSCEDAAGLASAQAMVPVATDNCDVTLTPVKTSGLFVSAGCGYSGSYTNTFKVTDDCGNVSGTYTQVITITDTKAPVIVGTLSSTTVFGCSIADAPPAATTAQGLLDLGLTSISDNCTPFNSLTVSYSDTNNGKCPIYIYRTYKVTDLCGNSTTITSTYIIKIEDKIAPTITNVPLATTYSCGSDVPAGQISSVTVNDDCLGFVTVLVSDVTTSGSCVNKYSVNRIWTATDVCGNVSTATQVITVDDQTKPVIQTFPADVTVSCSGDIPAANTSSVTATDNCSGTVSITVDADVISNQSCANQYTIKRTYWATDICGNKTSKIQTITVNDNVAPTISSIPANVTVSCVAEIPVANTSSVTASDNCSGTVSVTVSADVVSNKTCDNRYTISRTYFATDVCGNTSSKTQTILVDDEIAPVISSIPADVTVSCASEVPLANTASVTASDNCNGTVSITVSADVISNQGCANRYTITRTYTATDVCGNKSTRNQTITVFDNTPPVISGVPSSQTYHCASEVPAGQIGSVTVADNCSGVVNVTVTDVTTQGNCANRYTITRTWTATDLCGNTTSASQSITVYDDIAPQITGVPQSQTYSCAADVPSAQASSVVATDNCSGAVTVTVTDTRVDDSCANRYTLTRVWVATDACGNTTSATQVITVNDQTPPAISGTISETTVSGCSVTDLPAAATTVQGLATLGLTVTDGCSGTASLTVTSKETVTGSCPIVVSRIYSISDACGNMSTYTQTINVMDTTAPVITGTASVVTVEGCSAQAAPAKITTAAGLAALGLTITDNCTGSASLTVTSNDVATGSCPIVVTRVYRIADVCGNASTFTQTINITDTTAPVIVGTLNTLNIEGCSAASAPAAANTVGALEAMGVSISDNCSADGEMTVTSSDVSQGGCSAIVTRTYRITDKCGNPITAVQTIRVNDVTPPSVSGTLNTLAVEGCSAADAAAAVTTVSGLEAMGVSITDGCTADANLLVTSTQTSTGTCPIVVTRVYQVTDACGNSVNLTQAIRVGDTTAPTARGKNIILPLTPQGTASITASDIDGGSIDNCGIKTRIASKTLFTCSQLGAQTVTLTVIDNCGNTSTTTAVVTVIDPTPASLSINDVEVSEAVGSATLTVTLSSPRACDVSFTVNTTNNTAIAPADYTTVSSTVYTIPGGSTTVTVFVPIVNDKIAEPTETFFVRIANPINGVIADDQGTVSILDDDSPPTVLIGDASANEGDKLYFPVTLSNVSSGDITITLGFTHVTTSDGDFVTTPVTVTFPMGTVSATAVVQTNDDYIQEANETFIVKVVGYTGPVGNTSDTGTGTIIDNDKKPIAVDDHLTIDEDNKLTNNVNVNDHPNMAPGDVWTLLTQPSHGTVTMNPDGSFVYTPNANYNGNDSFTYNLCDADGDCDDATVFITMNPVDDFPVANDDEFIAYMDGSVQDNVSKNDIPSGDGGNVWTIVKQPATGTVIINPDGTFTYTPNVGYLGNDSFTYKLCDVDGDCDEAVVNIVVEDIIPNQVFTPNGDNQNDKYYVKNIEFYPGSRIMIFNRWGNKVYEKTGYLNDWDGYSNVSKVGSSPLPVGTYYYVIDYGVNRHKTGYVYLER